MKAVNVYLNPVVFFMQWWWVGFDLHIGHTTWGLHFKSIRDRFVQLDSNFLLQIKKITSAVWVKIIDTVKYFTDVIKYLDVACI